MALHVSVLEQKISKVLTFAISIYILKQYLYFFIVILKCYQTAFQYLGNVTLSLVDISRHDKNFNRLGCHFVLRTVSALTGFWFHE